MPLLYLAGAIDRSSNPEYGLDELIISLDKFYPQYAIEGPLIIYTPALAFRGTEGPMDQRSARIIFNINMIALQMADAVLVRYDQGVETWGTPMEVFAAYLGDTGVFAWGEFHELNGVTQLRTVLPKHATPPYLTAMLEEEKVYANQDAVAEAVMQYLVRKESKSDLEESMQDLMRGSMP